MKKIDKFAKTRVDRGYVFKRVRYSYYYNDKTKEWIPVTHYFNDKGVEVRVHEGRGCYREYQAMDIVDYWLENDYHRKKFQEEEKAQQEEFKIVDKALDDYDRSVLEHNISRSYNKLPLKILKERVNAEFSNSRSDYLKFKRVKEKLDNIKIKLMDGNNAN